MSILESKISTILGMGIILLFILPTGFFVYNKFLIFFDEVNVSTNNINLLQLNKEDEKQKIDRWIAENNLNQYGDPKGTYYVGGSPLFDESTGKKIDRYEYIIKKNPDKPWNKKDTK